MAKKNSSLESAKASLIPYEKKLIKKQESLNKILDRIRNYEESKRIKAQKSKMLIEKVEDLNKRIKFDKESNKRSEFSISSIEKEMKSLEKELKKIITNLDKTKEEYLKYEEKLKDKNVKISDIKEVEDHFRELTHNIESLLNKRNQLEGLINIEKIDRKKILNKVISLDNEITSLKNAIGIIESLFKTENKEIIRINKLFTDKSKDLSKNEILFNNLKNKIESLKKEVDYKSVTFKSNNKRIEDNIKLLEKSEKEINSLGSESDSKDNLLIKLYDDKNSSESDLEKFEDE